MKNSNLRTRCFDVIDSCVNKEQMRAAFNYMILAGLQNDSLTKAWFEMKMEIIGNI